MFRDLQAQINGAMQHLCNAVGVWRGGKPFPLMWERQALGSDPFVEVSSASVFELSCPSEHCLGIAEGSKDLVIDGRKTVITSPVHTDSSGWLTAKFVWGE